MKAIRNAVLGGLAAVFVAGAGTAETLTEALVTAYENSNLLDKNRATLRATTRTWRRRSRFSGPCSTSSLPPAIPMSAPIRAR